jgi:hypothetical protein
LQFSRHFQVKHLLAEVATFILVKALLEDDRSRLSQSSFPEFLNLFKSRTSIVECVADPRVVASS